MLNRRRLLLGATALAAAAAVVNPLLAGRANAAEAAGEDVVAWLKANALPLATVEPGSAFDDLAPLRAMLGKARIVSLGEATHGTREFFKLKHRLIEYCVSELGFSIIAFEANYGNMLAVNDFVLEGKGNASDAVAGIGYPIYDTEEVLALVEWVRTWNLSHERKVQFHGLDMQSTAAAALHLLAYLEKVAPELAAESEPILAPLVSQFTLFTLPRLAASKQERVVAQIEDVIGAFAAERASWGTRASESEWHLARQSAEVLAQFMRATLAADSEKGFTIRDRAMANTARALLEAGGPDAKALLWAHNGHVKRSAGYDFPIGRLDVPTMGSFLHAMFGAEHVVIGFAFNQGAFRVAVDRIGNLDGRVVGPAPAGYVDATMAATGLPLFAIDLTQVPADGPVARWMSSRPRQRMLGNGVFRPEIEHRLDYAADPRDNYDAILFVESATAAQGNSRLPQREAKGPVNAEPVNLMLAGSNGMPNGWGEIESGFYSTDRYPFVAAVTDEPSLGGGQAVRIARAPSSLPWGDGAIGQSFPAAALRGRRLTFSAAMRADAPRLGTGAQILLEVWPKGEGARSIVALQTDGPVRSPQWTRRSIAVDVPADAERIRISLVMTGDGAGLFGDLELAASASHGEYDLSEMLVRPHHRERFGHLLEWEGLVDRQR